MKKIILLTVILFSSLSFYAQEKVKNDIVLKLNGDELVGKVSRISDDDIEFTYAGETLVYNIKKQDIMKITFSSGRIQVFNKPSLPSKSDGTTSNPANNSGAQSLEEHHNKVALLPFTVVKDGEYTADVIGDQVQAECFSMLSKHAGVYSIMDTRTTNALLAKAGVNKDNIKTFTMDELCNILGVEYVIDCLISINKTTQVQTNSSSGQLTDKREYNKDNNNDKAKYNAYSSSTSTQNYKTSLNLSIYNDKNANVYSQERTSFWSTDDAYKSTLEYLLKRTPLYTK